MQAWEQRIKSDYKNMATEGKRYIACDDVDFSWLEEEVIQSITMWKGGVSVCNMADTLDRPTIDVFCLLLDLLENAKIHKRKGGFYGRR